MLVTTAVKMPTNFFDLPAEIRNQIYYEVLVPAGGVRPTQHIPPPTEAQQPSRSIADPSFYSPGSYPAEEGISEQHFSQARPSLLMAHPQIRRKADLLCLRNNSFVFELDYDDIVAGVPAISAWFRSLGSQGMRQVGSIVLYFRHHFTVEIGHAEVNERPTLVLQHLHLDTEERDWETFPRLDPATWAWEGTVTNPDDDRPVIASIEQALRDTLDLPEQGLQIPGGYNLLGGIAQFMLNLSASINWNFDFDWHNCSHFVKGEAYVKTDKGWMNPQGLPHPHNPKGGLSW